MKAPEWWVLDNGLTVLYRQDANFPLVFATLLLRVGSRQEQPDQAGLCSMTVDLLMQGTRRRSARGIARVLESAGASMGTQVHEDYAEIGFVAPASALDRALDTSANVLREPAFPQVEIAKEKAHVLASLASRRDVLFNRAYDLLNETLYGNHPYGRPLEGFSETVRTFDRRTFRAWHARSIRPEAGILSVVGPMSASDASRRLEKSWGAWRPSQAHRSLTPPSPVRPLKKSQSLRIASSFEQAYLMVGWQVPGAAHQDQILLQVFNALMGGGMSSRLFVTLREKRGLAYEVSSFYPTRLDVSQWVVYLGLPKDKVSTAAHALDVLLHQMADRGPTAEEVRQAKAMIAGSFLMDRQSRRRQAWYGAWWEFLGRPQTYGEDFLKAMDAVSPKAVRNLVRNLLAQPRVSVTVVPR